MYRISVSYKFFEWNKGKYYLYFDDKFFEGIIYDVIVEPPSVGSTTDEHGHTRPVSKWK